MKKKHLLKEVFQLQKELNCFVWEKKELVGAHVLWTDPNTSLDSVDEFRREWALRFTRAAYHEIFEAIQADIETKDTFTFSTDPRQSYKVELIDILHFVVSIAIILKLDIKPLTKAPTKNTLVDLALFLNKVDDELNWKWWSKKEESDLSIITESVGGALNTLLKLLDLESCDFDDVLKIYRQKHAVNMGRQKTDYSRRTKTEADNESIKT